MVSDVLRGRSVLGTLDGGGSDSEREMKLFDMWVVCSFSGRFSEKDVTGMLRG